jgi:excisionase family DNA binding protein
MPRTYADPTIPSDTDVLLAREAGHLLSDGGDGQPVRLQLVRPGHPSTVIDLPAPAAHLLKQMLQEMGGGHAVALAALETEITTQEAADLLTVSRPFVVGLIDKGLLPARMVGAHRRVRLQDVLAYKAASKTQARAALKEMVAISQELGLE